MADPAVVLVGGEAGVGKTRLVAELTAAAPPTGRGCWPAAVCRSATAPCPMPRSWRRCGPCRPSSALDAVRELVGPSWPELARLLPALGEPETGPAWPGRPGAAVRAAARPARAGSASRRRWSWWSRTCTGPTTPPATCSPSWSATCAASGSCWWSPTATTSRASSGWGPIWPSWTAAAAVQRIELARLDQAQTAAQLVGILGAAPAADLVDAVFARSEGNPFFTEELLAVGAGRLGRAASDRCATCSAAGSRRCPSRPRQVLAVAAVAGRRVPHRLLATVAGLDDRDLLEALREAVAHQLLVTRPGEDGYEFRHALLREVVDADLLPGERARLHAGLRPGADRAA